MIEEYGFRRVGPSTRLFGVASTNALDSLSPPMHNAAFEAAGVDAVYAPFATEEFSDFLAFASALDVEGVSVTIPFKLDALRAAETCDDVARHVGAANTLRRRHGRWEATNTDLAGFLAPLESELGRSPAGLRAAVLGAGGAARAVVAALCSRGARVTVHARRRQQAKEVAGAFGVAIGPWPPEPGSWDLLVNCTPLGGSGRRGESPMSVREMTGRFVYDLTYGEGPSALLAAARSAGCFALDGIPMLVAQAERQFEWWTGQPPEAGVMDRAARRSLRRPAEAPRGAGDANHHVR
jgi:shikimate dehydrogenase